MNKSISKILFTLFILIEVAGCDDNEDPQIPQDEKVSVEFDTTQLMIHENDVLQLISLSLKKPARNNGVLTLSVSNTDTSRFNTEPALFNGMISLNVLEGQNSVIIKIIPGNNSHADGNLEFTMTILETSPDLIPGRRDSILVKLLDDDSANPIQESIADFIGADKNVLENSIAGKTYSIKLSEILSAPGSVEISLESAHAVYGTHYKTIPGATNGRVILSLAIGEGQTSLTVIPIDNSIITGEFEIILTITGTTGSIVKGSELTQVVSIVDDELINKPKGYVVSGGGWSLKKIYEYDEQGRVKYVHIEKSTPVTRINKETYIYDTDGRIQKINTYPQTDVVYTWSNNRIIRSESVSNGVVTEYILYDYDAKGNVSGAAVYFRQPDGQFKLGFLTNYLYFLDGNIYKSLTYIPNEGSNEYTLISTKTYDQYIYAANPFPMVEILPTVKTQTNLPGVYILEENGVTLNYTFTYEFREDGLVSGRLARSGNLSETAIYMYY